MESIEKTLAEIPDGSVLLIEREYQGKHYESAGVYFKHLQFGWAPPGMHLQTLSMDGILGMKQRGGFSSSSCIVIYSQIRKISILKPQEVYRTD